MRVIPLGELMPSRIPSINPNAFPDEQFTLWSIPSYDTGRPEHVLGRDIGSSKKVVQDGDVLLSKIVPHIRRAWKVSVSDDRRQIASSEWITFRHQEFLSEYLRHFFLTDDFHRQFMGTVAGVGGSLLRAQPKSVAKIAIPLPPLEQQRRIVAVLDRAAAIRRRADAARAKARAIIPALFLDMFGDPTSNVKGWPVRAFSDVIKVRSGNFLPAKTMEKSGSFPVYGGNGINGYHSEFMFEDSKIVIGRVGALCGNIHISKPRSWITDNALYVAESSPQLDKYYLAMSLTQARLNERASQSGQPLISAGRLASVPILVPPLALQTAFAEQVQRIEAIGRGLDTAAAKAEALAASLSAEVFG